MKNYLPFFSAIIFFQLKMGESFENVIYKPTNQNTIIISQTDGYCEIFLNGDYKTVSVNDLAFEEEELKLSSLDELKENVFIKCIIQ